VLLFRVHTAVYYFFLWHRTNRRGACGDDYYYFVMEYRHLNNLDMQITYRRLHTTKPVDQDQTRNDAMCNEYLVSSYEKNTA